MSRADIPPVGGDVVGSHASARIKNFRLDVASATAFFPTAAPLMCARVFSFPATRRKTVGMAEPAHVPCHRQCRMPVARTHQVTIPINAWTQIGLSRTETQRRYFLPWWTARFGCFANIRRPRPTGPSRARSSGDVDIAKPSRSRTC